MAAQGTELAVLRAEGASSPGDKAGSTLELARLEGELSWARSRLAASEREAARLSEAEARGAERLAVSETQLTVLAQRVKVVEQELDQVRKGGLLAQHSSLLSHAHPHLPLSSPRLLPSSRPGWRPQSWVTFAAVFPSCWTCVTPS